MVTLFMVFTFGRGGAKLVRSNDWVDEAYALQVLVA